MTSFFSPRLLQGKVNRATKRLRQGKVAARETQGYHKARQGKARQGQPNQGKKKTNQGNKGKANQAKASLRKTRVNSSQYTTTEGGSTQAEGETVATRVRDRSENPSRPSLADGHKVDPAHIPRTRRASESERALEQTPNTHTQHQLLSASTPSKVPHHYH